MRFSLPNLFSTFISTPYQLPALISLSVMACSTVSSIARNTSFSAHFTVPIICPETCTGHKMHFLYKTCMHNILPSYQNFTSYCRHTRRNIGKNAKFSIKLGICLYKGEGKNIIHSTNIMKKWMQSFAYSSLDGCYWWMIRPYSWLKDQRFLSNRGLDGLQDRSGRMIGFLLPRTETFFCCPCRSLFTVPTGLSRHLV